MSTCNFCNQDNFDLFVKVYELKKEEFKEQYFDEYNCYYEDYVKAETEDEKENILDKAYNDFYVFDCNIFYEEIYDNCDGFKTVMDDFNDTLLFHKVEFKSGYYDGIQLYIEEKENPNYLDNEDCRYYFDLCRSVAKRKYKSEINKINKWLSKVPTQYGWRKLNLIGIFSNGEAIYEFAS